MSIGISNGIWPLMTLVRVGGEVAGGGSGSGTASAALAASAQSIKVAADDIFATRRATSDSLSSKIASRATSTFAHALYSLLTHLCCINHAENGFQPPCCCGSSLSSSWAC